MINSFTNKLSARAIFLVSSMALAFAFSACASDPQGRSMGRTMDDAWITSKVKSSLLADDLVPAGAVSVETYQGKVMLSGFVETENQINRAVEVAKSVEGVQQVVNKMEVRPKSIGRSGTSGDMGTSGEMNRSGERPSSGSGSFDESPPESQSRIP